MIIEIGRQRSFRKCIVLLVVSLSRQARHLMAGEEIFCYNRNMKNWSVDEERFKKEDPEGHQVWRLEQLINYGLDGEKLDPALLKKYWGRLVLDPAAKRYLEFLLWPEKRAY